jgi:hypothetical protein
MQKITRVHRAVVTLVLLATNAIVQVTRSEVAVIQMCENKVPAAIVQGAQDQAVIKGIYLIVRTA